MFFTWPLRLSSPITKPPAQGWDKTVHCGWRLIFFSQFGEILFVDETTGQKAFFKYKLGSPLVAMGNFGVRLPALFVGGGIANTNYEYQLLICDNPFYSGFFVSGFTNCLKRCNHWCSDVVSPYFRSAATHAGYKGVAFNVNGHSPRNNRLISVGLRWVLVIKAFTRHHIHPGHFTLLVTL